MWLSIVRFIACCLLLPLILSTAVMAQVPNDDRATATVVDGLPFVDQVNTRVANEDPNDPVLSCADGGGGKTVWYVFTPATSMFLSLHTRGSRPEDYDTALGVFTGSCDSLTEVNCNDDIEAGVVRQSELLFEAHAGIAYYIHVAEWNGGGPNGGVPTGGDLVFNIEETPAPPLYQGPADGSIARGRSVTTDNFGLAESSRQPRIHNKQVHSHDIELRPDPPKLSQPSAPAGDNEVLDLSVKMKEGDREPNAPRALSSFPGVPQSNFIPPDPHIACGPDHLIATINSTFSILDKSGAVLKTIEAADWLRNVLPDTDPCDPQVLFDPHSNRWFMVWIECGGSLTSLLLSMSDDENPLGSWCNWRINADRNGNQQSGLFNDYPKIGVDSVAVYVTSNMFAADFEYVQVRMIPKEQLLNNSCGAVTWTDFWDLRDPENLADPVITVVPAVNFETTATQYFINDSPFETGNHMTLWSLADSSGQPKLSAVNVPVTASIGRPLNADQLGGSSTLIDAGGRRVRNAVYMNGSLWTSHSVPGGANRAYAFARSLRIDVASATTLEDVAFGANGFWYTYPAIQPDLNGNMHMVFTRSGTREYASVRYTGRLANEPPGLQASALLKAGEANYVITDNSGRNRWGDYSGIALDPADGSRVWMHGEYADAPANNWGTWIGSVSFTPLPGKHLNVDIQSVEFGTLEVGQNSETTQVVVSNVGTDSLTILNLNGQSSSFKLNAVPALPMTLPSFGEIVFEVQFVPDKPGALRDTIRIVSDDTFSMARVVLSGNALGFADFSGALEDSVSGLPVQAVIQCTRHGESSPRATITTDSTGGFSALLLEGIYDIEIRCEVPYPEVRLEDFEHSLAGSARNFRLAAAPILFVHDDTSSASAVIYRDLLDQLGQPYAKWSTDTQGEAPGSESLARLAEPAIVIWATGQDSVEGLSNVARLRLREHLDRGNALFLTGDDVAERSLPDDTLMAQYLGVRFAGNSSLVPIRSFPNDPVGVGLTTGAAGASKDQLQLTSSPAGNVHKVFRYGTSAVDSTRIAAVRAEHPVRQWRAGYFAFRLEAVTVLHRRQILERVVDWLSEGPSVAVNERENEPLPQRFHLAQNHPNPFNPSTTIGYELPVNAFVTLKVYNLLGREVMTLLHEKQEAGRHEILFNAEGLAAGVYIYRMSAGEFAATRKLVVLK